MPTYTLNSAGPNYADYSLQQRVNNIRSRIAGDRIIRAQDIQDLAYIYNTWINHSHNYTDNQYLAFGNKPGGSTGAWTATSTNVINNPGGYAAPGAGGVINGNQIWNLVNMINSIRSHSHNYTDSYWNA